MNIDYANLSIRELEELSKNILELIELKKKLKFSDEYLSELRELLDRFDEDLTLNLGATNIFTYYDGNDISISYETKKKIHFSLKEKLGEWRLNLAFVASKCGFDRILIESRPIGSMVMKNGLCLQILDNKVYSTLAQLEKGLKDISRELEKY